MRAQPTCVSRLLKIYHGRTPPDVETEVLPNAEQINFLCAVGLGPIAFRAYGKQFKKSDPELFSVLHSAELTTRLIYGQLENAAVELTRELHGVGIVPVFLKGISAAKEYYSPPHHRVMSDVDILVREPEVDIVMDKISDLGYRISDEQWRSYRKTDHHHLPEARHPETGVSLEVHTGLFSPEEFYADEDVFQTDSIHGQCVDFDFEGFPAARLTPEFQFVFTVSKWSVDRDWAINLKNINDIVHLLRRHEATFDWPLLSKWFASNAHLSPITAALMRYLEAADIVTLSPGMREIVTAADGQVSSRTVKSLAWLLHTFPFNARNRKYSGYARWSAHALWLYLTMPDKSSFGIPTALWQQFYLSALYGKYSPLSKLFPGNKSNDRQKK